MNKLKQLINSIVLKEFATSKEKEEVKTLYKELKEDEKEEVKEEVEEVEKLPEEEPKSTEDVVDEAAEKINKIIEVKLAEALKAKEVKEVKKELPFSTDADIKANDYDVIMYTKKDGSKVTLKRYEAESLGKWFKSYAEFATSKSPDAWAEMKKEFNTLEKYAVQQKLEPLTTITGASGGNLVPTILFNEIIPLLEDMAVIRPNARTIDMTGVKTLDLPSIATKPYVSWNAEAAQKSTTSVTFGTLSLTPYILAGIIPVTTQMIDDSPFNVIQLVSELLAEAVAKEEDRAFMNGTGAGQPTGITTYGAGTTVSAGGALDFTHFNALYYAMPQKHRASSKLAWIMHSDTLATVANMQDGNNRPIIDIFNPLSGAGFPTIRSAKVLEQNDISNNIIYLVDLAFYWIGVSRAMGIDISREATIGGNDGAINGQNMWERNMIAIRIETKLDAELVSTRALGTITAVRT